MDIFYTVMIGTTAQDGRATDYFLIFYFAFYTLTCGGAVSELSEHSKHIQHSKYRRSTGGEVCHGYRRE